MIATAIGRPIPTALPSIITKSRSRPVPTRTDIPLTPSGPARRGLSLVEQCCRDCVVRRSAKELVSTRLQKPLARTAGLSQLKSGGVVRLRPLKGPQNREDYVAPWSPQQAKRGTNEAQRLFTVLGLVTASAV